MLEEIFLQILSVMSTDLSIINSSKFWKFWFTSKSKKVRKLVKIEPKNQNFPTFSYSVKFLLKQHVFQHP